MIAVSEARRVSEACSDEPAQGDGRNAVRILNENLGRLVMRKVSLWHHITDIIVSCAAAIEPGEIGVAVVVGVCAIHCMFQSPFLSIPR